MSALCAHHGGLRTALHPKPNSQPVSLASFRSDRPTWTPGRLPALHQRRAVRRSAGQNGRPFVELLADTLPGKGELLSVRLDPAVRRRAEAAVAARGGRVTVGDVAASSGLSLYQAEDALRALAADSQAALQVTDDGQIVYVFAKGFRDAIRNKSLLLRLEPLAAQVSSAASYVARVAFGTALVVSVVSVYVAITVISSSKDERGGRRGGGYYGGGGRMMFDITDVLWYWDPFYYQRRAMLRAAASAAGRVPEGMGFLESIFSFVFGDGDPNAAYEQRRWEDLGRYIQYRGGVVTAEEMAPFLDVTPEQVSAGADRERTVVDESYVLPALARFGGSPEVDPAGRILYRFDSLQQTGRAARASPPSPAALEAPWKLTEATAGQQAGVVALGLVNLAGVVVLGSMLATPANAVALARSGMAWVAGALPLLQAYAASFFAVPALRWLLNQRRNAAIEARNAGREAALRALQRPSAGLKSKLDSAAQQAQRRVISERDVVYRSDRAVGEQPADIEGEAWERQLERRAAAREQQQQQQQQPRGTPVPVRQAPPPPQGRRRAGGFW